jgi:two-component system, NtrC family, sensor histidine kinase HydH
MTALVYFLVAGTAAFLATRAWLGDRTHPARVAFLGLGWMVAAAFTLFALSLLPGLGALRLGWMAAGSLTPALALYTFDRVFQERPRPPSPLAVRLLVLSAGVVPLAVGLHAAFYLGIAGASPPQLALGVFAFGILGVLLLRLWQVHESTRLRVDKVRLRYLVGVTSGAVVLALAEQLGRVLAPPDPATGLAFTARAVALQGPLPPLSVLLTGVGLYFLYHTVVNYRLLDLYEIFSRVSALVASAMVLVVIDGLAILWVDTFQGYPLHLAFQAFVASVLFLAIYDPLKHQIDWWANRLLNRRGHQLAEAIGALRSELPAATSKEALTHVILRRLHGSGRVPVCSVYLWEASRDAYGLLGIRGEVNPEPLAAVAGPPFTDGFTEEGRRWYARVELARRARADDPLAVELLQLMDAMHADLTVPFRSGEVVLGWMHLRDEEWSDGFSADEIHRLVEVADLATVSLSNIEEFSKLEEAHRLAALGAMAAGLAHEIRNPLAGIKGAAQYLQAENLESDAEDMLDVVVTEVDRLNVVVSQFLEYARPFELDTAQDHLNAIVTHVLHVLRAQGVPDGVTLVEELGPDLPPVSVDRHRLSQVLLNLCQNGLQAMPHGGTLTVRTRKRTSRQGRTFLEVAVHDTGAGIPGEALEKLFVPFFTTKESGTGLGLPISQRIVQAHGGDLEVSSQPGRGSTFQVVLPLPREDTEQPDDAPEPAAQEPAAK